jgi:hypothetical protein
MNCSSIDFHYCYQLKVKITHCYTFWVFFLINRILKKRVDAFNYHIHLEKPNTIILKIFTRSRYKNNTKYKITSKPNIPKDEPIVKSK